MCGHWGVIFKDPRRVPQEDWLAKGADTIFHRGPDDQGLYVKGPIGAAFRRLSIIDLEGGHQPLENEDGSVAVLVNGEIYNFKELRAELEGCGYRFRTHSDCETVLYGYIEWGAAFVERLIGMFAIAVLDSRVPGAPKVMLARDRVGIKPVYYAYNDKGLYWASEPKALLSTGDFTRRMRAPKLLDYLVQGYTGGADSAWEGIQRLEPGHVLEFQVNPSSQQAPKVSRYWDLPTDGLRSVDPDRLDEEVLELLDQVVSDRLVADVPLGAFLSGGIDSTAVCDSMARQIGEGVIACSVGFQEKSHNELDIAKATAERIGAVHHTEILEPDPKLALDVLPWFYDEPLADPSTVPTYLVSKMAREHVTVALSGDGGDETFAGYRRYVHDVAENRLRAALPAPGLFRLAGAVYPKLDWAPRVVRAKTFLSNLGAEPGRAYFQSVSMLGRDEAAALLAPDLRRSLADHDPFHAFEEHYRRPKIDDPLYRAQYADYHTYLCDQILTKVDRASMGVSLEVRVPILDHRFGERFANLPRQQKVAGGRGKVALREALRSRLPSQVLDGQKRGFDTPLKAWIKGPMFEAVRAAVNELPEAWIDRKAVRALLEEHKSGARDHGRTLWSLMVLEQWRKRHEVADELA